MRLYNENAGVEFDAWFETQPGVPTVPTTVHWCLRNATHDETRKVHTSVPYVIESDETGITGVRARIDVPGTLNTIMDRKNRRETMELEVIADMGSDREYSLTPVHQYYIQRTSAR
jgi:hypothetical protein